MEFQSILWRKHPIALFELQSLYCNLLEPVSLQRVERCPRKKILSCRWILHEIFSIDGMIGFITIISLFSIEFNVSIFNKTVGTVYISIAIISSDICTICQLVFFEICSLHCTSQKELLHRNCPQQSKNHPFLVSTVSNGCVKRCFQVKNVFVSFHKLRISMTSFY